MLVFKASIPTALVFLQKTFCDLYLYHVKVNCYSHLQGSQDVAIYVQF